MGAFGNCCCKDCTIGTDDFNRADANPPTGDWSVVSGEWEIDGNQLEVVTEGPIVTTLRQRASTRPNTEYSIKMYFLCKNVTEGSVFKVICGYENSNTFHWIELTRVGTSMMPKFYSRAGGVDTLLMDIGTHPGGIGFPVDTSGNTFAGKICYSQDDWTLDAGSGLGESGLGLEFQNSETQWTYTGEGGQGSLPTTLGMVGFLFGDFDDFAFHYHWESRVPCDYCSCICRNPDDVDDYRQFPEELLLTFVPLFDPSTYPCELNNATLILKQGEVLSGTHELSPRKYLWTNDGPGDDTPASLVAFFYCNNSTGPVETRFTLCIGIPGLSGTFIWGTTTGPVGYPCDNVDWSESSCVPLSLTFQPLSAGPTTCEIVPGVGPQGLKHPLCPIEGPCLEENPTNDAFLRGLQWKLVITEV
jgi:hypothetical protein